MRTTREGVSPSTLFNFRFDLSDMLLERIFCHVFACYIKDNPSVIRQMSIRLTLTEPNRITGLSNCVLFAQLSSQPSVHCPL